MMVVCSASTVLVLPAKFESIRTVPTLPSYREYQGGVTPIDSIVTAATAGQTLTGSLRRFDC